MVAIFVLLAVYSVAANVCCSFNEAVHNCMELLTLTIHCSSTMYGRTAVLNADYSITNNIKNSYGLCAIMHLILENLILICSCSFITYVWLKP